MTLALSELLILHSAISAILTRLCTRSPAITWVKVSGSFWDPLQLPGKVSEREIRHEGPNTAMTFEELRSLSSHLSNGSAATIKNKARISPLTSPFQHFAASPG